MPMASAITPITDDDNDTIPDTVELLSGRNPLVADWAVSAGNGPHLRDR